MNTEKTVVVFAIEKSQSFKLYLPEILEDYIKPMITYFSGGVNEETDIFFTQTSLVKYCIVFFGAHAAMLNAHGGNGCESIGPTTSQNKIMKSIKEAKYIDFNIDRHAYVLEGIKTSIEVFQELCGDNDSVRKCLVLVTQSAPMAHPWSGTLEESVFIDLKKLNIKTSIIGTHKRKELVKIFEKSGGDIQSIHLHNYASKPEHLVLLNGISLQERAISPSLMPQAATQSSALHSSSPITASPMAVNNTNQNMQNSQQANMMRMSQPNAMMPNVPTNTMNQQARPNWNMGSGPMVAQSSPQQIDMNKPMTNTAGQMMPGNPSNVMSMQPRNHIVWQGHLEWSEKKNGPSGGSLLNRLACKIQVIKANTEIKTDNWPPLLQMFIVNRTIVASVGESLFQNNSRVQFIPEPCPACESLFQSLSSGNAGCVQISSTNTEIKMIVLLLATNRTFVGFIPMDQTTFVARINQVFNQQNRRIPQQGNVRQSVVNPMMQQVAGGQSGGQIMNTGMNTNQQSMMMQNQMSQQMNPGMSNNTMVNSSMNQGGMSQAQNMNMTPGSQMSMAVPQGNQMAQNSSVLSNQLMRPSIQSNPMGSMTQQPEGMNVRQALQHQGNIRQMRPSMPMGMNQSRMIQGQNMQSQDLRQMLQQRFQHQHQQQMMMMQQGMRGSMPAPNMGQPGTNMSQGQQMQMGQTNMSQQNMQQQNMQQQNMPLQDDNPDYLGML